MAPRPVTGLVLVALLASAHAGAHALLRPLYQVSDEIVYLGTVQAAALAAAPEMSACVAPPDGRFPRIDATTKPGFLRMTAAQLRTICRAGAGSTSLLWLRLLQALSLGVVAGCAWGLARLLTGRDTDALLAGLLVAAHPVAATYAGGVTPDAWANAFSAVALLAATRLVLDAGRWWDVAVLLASSVAAFAWKDTTAFVLALPVAVAALTATRARARNTGRWVLVAGGLAATAIVVTAALLWFRSPYLAAARTADIGSAARLAGALVADLMAQAGPYLASTWSGIGSFGANTLTIAPSATAIGVLLLGAGLVGAVVRGAGHPPRVRPALAIWALSGLVCLLLPSVRQVLLDAQDVHQGRWLLPVLTPAAAVLACGLLGLPGLRQRALPLWVLMALTPAWSGLIQTARYFWQAYPATLHESMLFLRSTGGGLLDDAFVLQVVRGNAAAIPHALPVLVFLSLGLLSLATSLFSARVAPFDHHAHTHDR